MDKTDTQQKHAKTRGEKIFNATSWWGIGGFLNAATSIVIADQTKHGSLALGTLSLRDRISRLPGIRKGEAKTLEEEKLCGEFVHHAQEYDSFGYNKDVHLSSGEFFDSLLTDDKKALTDEAKKHLEGFKAEIAQKEGVSEALKTKVATLDGEEFCKLAEKAMEINRSKGWAMIVLGTTALSSGGYILMAPIKWMEDHKLFWSKKFDNWFGKKNMSESELAERDARYKEIEAEPKQSWPSVMLSRIASVIPIYLFAINMDGPDNPFRKNSKGYEGNAHYAQEAAEWMEEKLSGNPTTNAALEKVEAGLQKGLDARVAKYEKASHETAEAYKDKILNRNDPDPAKHLNGKQRFVNIMGLSSLEVIYATIAATEAFIASRVLAPFFNGHNKKKTPAPEKQDTPIPQDTKPAIEPEPPSKPAPTQENEDKNPLADPVAQVASAQHMDRVSTPDVEQHIS